MRNHPRELQRDFFSARRLKRKFSYHVAFTHVERAGITRDFAFEVYLLPVRRNFDGQGIDVIDYRMETLGKARSAPYMMIWIIFVNAVYHHEGVAFIRASVKTLFKKTSDADIAVCERKNRFVYLVCLFRIFRFDDFPFVRNES